MGKKYNEHKKNCQLRNEDNSTIFSESENIDDLINYCEIDTTKKSAIIRSLTQEEVDSFIAAKKASGLALSIGVSLYIMSIIASILMYTLIDDYIISEKILGLIVPLAIIVSATPFLIYSGRKMKKYKYLKSGFEYSLNMAVTIELKNSAFVSLYFWSSFIAGCLFIISPSGIALDYHYHYDLCNYGVVIMLTMVCIAASIFIYVSSINEGFKILLRKRDFSKIKTPNNKLTLRVVVAIWSLSVSIFFISGCIFTQWNLNWIVFPITSILLHIHKKSQ
ncbi:MAG: hypothetical protein ACREV6_21570 [Clostridium sp.]|uniref:hypothetical protein n=1 Tax=Clostridium sp. TaxID=1506 RepID=UPI003D6D7C89